MGSHSPPPRLMDHPPLAVFCNCMLHGLNDLRHVTSLSLHKRIHRIFCKSLETASLVLSHCREIVVIREYDVESYLNLCAAALDVTFPYLIDCFQALYPGIEKNLGAGKSATRNDLRAPLSSPTISTVNFPSMSLFGTESVGLL